MYIRMCYQNSAARTGVEAADTGMTRARTGAETGVTEAGPGARTGARTGLEAGLKASTENPFSRLFFQVYVTKSSKTGVVCNNNTFKLIKKAEDLYAVEEGGGAPTNKIFKLVSEEEGVAEGAGVVDPEGVASSLKLVRTGGTSTLFFP